MSLITFKGLYIAFKASTNVSYNTSLATYFCHRYSLSVIMHVLERFYKNVFFNSKAVGIHKQSCVELTILINLPFWLLM